MSKQTEANRAETAQHKAQTADRPDGRDAANADAACDTAAETPKKDNAAKTAGRQTENDATGAAEKTAGTAGKADDDAGTTGKTGGADGTTGKTAGADGATEKTGASDAADGKADAGGTDAADDKAKAAGDGGTAGAQPEAETASREEDEALQTKYLRLMADFQNYKRRAEKEKSDIYAYANEKLVTQLLNVIDSFERALAHESADPGFAQGMEMICKQLTDVLEKAGLEEIEALGADFDPNYHNAVMMEDNDAFESGKVTEVMQKGYLLNKKVIRPSMVKVNN